MILFVGLVFLTIFLVLGDPDITNYRGVPLWLSTSFVLLLGSAVITIGVWSTRDAAPGPRGIGQSG